MEGPDVDLSILLGAATACLVGGVFPWVNSEVAVVGAAALLPPTAVPLLVLGCTAAQMASKCGLYGITRWAPERLPERAQAMLGRVDQYRERRILLGLGVFSGAAVGLPPFYLVTLASGALRVPFIVFAIAGAGGTAARYGALVWATAALGF